MESKSLVSRQEADEEDRLPFMHGGPTPGGRRRRDLLTECTTNGANINQGLGKHRMKGIAEKLFFFKGSVSHPKGSERVDVLKFKQREDQFSLVG